MKNDSVLKEEYAIEDELARRYGNDIRKFCKAIREEQERSGRETVSLPRRERRT